MSFGFSISDAFALGQLAWNAVQNSRKACGEHDELTREVSALHVVLLRLQQEVEKPESPINNTGDTCREELQVIVDDCGKVLQMLDRILGKYNALGEQERSRRKLWQKVKFGNGEIGDIGKLRSNIVLYTSTMNFHLNMVSMGAVGRIEEKMNSAGGVLEHLQLAVDGIAARFIAKSTYEESVFTTYSDDEMAVWRELRRELIHDGIRSSVIRDHKYTIMNYVKELGSRGFLDDQDMFETSNAVPDAEINTTARSPTVESQSRLRQPVSTFSQELDRATSPRLMGDDDEIGTALESVLGHPGSEERGFNFVFPPTNPESTANQIPQLPKIQNTTSGGTDQAYAKLAINSGSYDSVTESMDILSPVLNNISKAAKKQPSDESPRQGLPVDNPNRSTAQDALEHIPIGNTPLASYDHQDTFENRVYSPVNNHNKKGKSPHVGRQSPSQHKAPLRLKKSALDPIFHTDEEESSMKVKYAGWPPAPRVLIPHAPVPAMGMDPRMDLRMSVEPPAEDFRNINIQTVESRSDTGNYERPRRPSRGPAFRRPSYYEGYNLTKVTIEYPWQRETWLRVKRTAMLVSQAELRENRSFFSQEKSCLGQYGSLTVFQQRQVDCLVKDRMIVDDPDFEYVFAAIMESQRHRRSSKPQMVLSVILRRQPRCGISFPPDVVTKPVPSPRAEIIDLTDSIDGKTASTRNLTIELD